MIRYLLSVVLIVVCACAPAQEETTAPDPTVIVELAEDDPPLCRPDDVPAGKLEIGRMSFEQPLEATSVVEEYGRAALELTLGGKDRTQLGVITAMSEGETLDFKFDGEVLMAPKIMEPITGGRVRISGNFTRAELEDIAIRLAPPCEP